MPTESCWRKNGGENERYLKYDSISSDVFFCVDGGKIHRFLFCVVTLLPLPFVSANDRCGEQ